MKKYIGKMALILLFLVMILIAFIRPCVNKSYGLIGKQRDCQCSGYEWVLNDTLSSTSNYMSVCIGVVKESVCYVNESNGNKVEVDCYWTDLYLKGVRYFFGMVVSFLNIQK